MNRLETLRVFCAAADAVNFREAASRLGVSPQVVTRAVRELELALGETLFHRSTRGVQLSSFGAQLVVQARAALGGVDALFPDPSDEGDPGYRGIVRIAAPTSVGRGFMMDVLAPHLRAHVDLRLDLRLSDAYADVVDQQIDVGVRIGQMRDSRFVARRACDVRFSVVGAPELIARVGVPKTIDDLMTRPLTAFIDGNSGRAWPWIFKGGRQLLPADPAFVTDDPVAEAQAVAHGLGFGQLPDYIAMPYIRAGQMTTVLGAQAPEPWSLYVYRSQRTPVPARVRLVFDVLIEAFRNAEKALRQTAVATAA